ncbi:MAG: polysaccharide biosynthesis tyrosine autokinase [Pseudobdellovibrionaceae bacterium]|jgi:capsular exopolysaccharide synthesis family protein|nr:polysaccharide biosynthesis tyrosine autokinase [Pseudobdellovibrionaceae bacterium]
MSSPTHHIAQNNEFELREILMSLWRHRILVLAIASLTFIIAFLVIVTRPTYYKSTASLMIEKGDLNLPDFVEVTGGDQFSNFTVQTEVKVLTSSDLALKTIEKINYGEKIGRPNAVPQDLLPSFIGSMNVMAQGGSKIIDVTFRSADPQSAALLANALVEQYLELQVENKQKEVNNLREWFHEKVGVLKDDVVKKSQAVETYRAQENLAIGKGSEELFLQDITDLSAQLTPVQVRKFDVEAKIKAIEMAIEENGTDDLESLTNTPAMTNLKNQEALAAQQVQELRARYGSKNPKLRAAQSVLAQTRSAMNREAQNTLEGLKGELLSIEAQEKLLAERLDEIKQISNEQREKLIHLKTLMVERDASQKQLDSFLANYESLQSQINFAQPDASVVSKAIAPAYPSNPSRIMLMVVAALFSGAVACGVVFVLEMLRTGLRNYDDIRRMGLKPIGIMPEQNQPNSSASMSVSNHREAIKKIYVASLAGTANKSILFSSALPQEGRTTLVFNLAHYLVSLNKKVLVIDADFVKPMLTHLCKVEEGPGLMEVLNGVANMRDVLVNTQGGFALMRRGDMVKLSPEGMASQSFDAMMTFLKKEFDYILIDSGPVLSHSESEVLSKKVDGIIIVTEWMKTSRKNVMNMVTTLRDISAPVLGVVLNHVDLDRYKKVTSGSDFLMARAN